MITESDVRHVAKLAKLALSDEEVRVVTRQLDDLLMHFDTLAELDTAGVPPTARPLPLHNVLRDDRVQGELTPDVALANAPSREDHFFRVPQIQGA